MKKATMNNERMKSKFKHLSIIAIFAFIFNLIWENAQAPFYGDFISFSQHFWPCFKGALGDIVIILALYLLFAGIYSDFNWTRKMNVTKTTWLVIAGAIVAIIIEKAALSVGRWTYGTMPLVPFFDAGIFPVLQMMVLPIITFKIAQRLSKYK